MGFPGAIAFHWGTELLCYERAKELAIIKKIDYLPNKTKTIKYKQNRKVAYYEQKNDQ